MAPIQDFHFRKSSLFSAATVVRRFTLPVLLLGATGWIPNETLDVTPKGPWPWGAITGLLLIALGVIGLLLPQPRAAEARSKSLS